MTKRTLIYSKEFLEFQASLNERSKEKLLYCQSVLISALPINKKFVKKIISSDFYELRISVDNELRVLLFAADNDNINQATIIYLLNGFVKKSSKDYDKNLRKAINILTKLIESHHD